MPIAMLDVSTNMLVSLCQGLTEGGNLEHRMYRVKENGLPPDTKVIRAELIGHHCDWQTIRIHVESEKFTEGAVLPPVWLESVQIPADDPGT